MSRVLFMRFIGPLHSAVSNSSIPSLDASLKKEHLVHIYISDLRRTCDLLDSFPAFVNGTVRTVE